VVLWVLSPLKAGSSFRRRPAGNLRAVPRLQFAPNHKGYAHESSAMRSSAFVRRQVITARNVRGGWFATVMLGGLNYQIEHHLFPMMPRPNLVRAQGNRPTILSRPRPALVARTAWPVPTAGLCTIWFAGSEKPCQLSRMGGARTGLLPAGPTALVPVSSCQEMGSVEPEWPAQAGRSRFQGGVAIPGTMNGWFAKTASRAQGAASPPTGQRRQVARPAQPCRHRSPSLG